MKNPSTTTRANAPAHLRERDLAGAGPTASATTGVASAGPVEATALGNVLIQARRHGVLSGDLDALSATVTEELLVDRYSPRVASSGRARS